MSLDDDFKLEKFELKKKYITILLSELIWLDYVYLNKKYNNTKGIDIWNSLKNDKYSKMDEEEIIKNAIMLAKFNHNIEVINFEDNIVKKVLDEE